MPQQRPPGSQWAKFLRYYHGLMPEQWRAMYIEQDGKCYLCTRPLPNDRKKVVIDHDHSCCQTTGHQSFSCRFCRRGLACSNCNAVIGMADDDPQRLRTIADSLEQAQAVTAALMLTRPEQGQLDIAAS